MAVTSGPCVVKIEMRLPASDVRNIHLAVCSRAWKLFQLSFSFPKYTNRVMLEWVQQHFDVINNEVNSVYA